MKIGLVVFSCNLDNNNNKKQINYLTNFDDNITCPILAEVINRATTPRLLYMISGLATAMLPVVSGRRVITRKSYCQQLKFVHLNFWMS